MGFLKRRSKLILVIAVLQICHSLSYGFSGFSSSPTSVQTSNSTALLMMDLETSLIQDFSDATNAEVNRFVAAYAKNGKDAAEKREAIETRLKAYLDWRRQNEIDSIRADKQSNDASTWLFAVQRAWDIEDSLAETDESRATNGKGGGDEVDANSCIEHNDIDQVIFFHKNETSGETICDKNKKRIMHLLPARINPDWANARTYANTFAVYMDHNMDRDSTEKLTIVIDIRAGTGWSNKSVLKMMGILRAIISTFETNFCERVDKFVVYPVPRLARGIFNTIKVLFDPKTAQKVALISGPDGVDAPVPREDIGEHIDFEVIDYMEAARKSLFRSS